MRYARALVYVDGRVVTVETLVSLAGECVYNCFVRGADIGLVWNEGNSSYMDVDEVVIRIGRWCTRDCREEETGPWDLFMDAVRVLVQEYLGPPLNDEMEQVDE